MIKIPGQTGQYTVPNKSDLFGSISYTKNIVLDEAGYIKLAPRAVSIFSEKTDSDLELPLSFGRNGSVGGTLSYKIITTQDPFDLDLEQISITIAQDTDSGVPTFNTDSRGVWFHNLWVATGVLSADDRLTSKTGSTWSNEADIENGKAHPVEVFRNKDSLCVGAGNTVLQYTESGGTFTGTTTLTIPSDYEVIDLAYANAKMGVLANLSDTTGGQNQEAYFFTWNGATTEAGVGVPIGSDRGIAVVPYKGSWVVFTREGQILHYTGGGFQTLATFPFYNKDLRWGEFTPDTFGDLIQVEGDRIFFNFNGKFNEKGLKYDTYSDSDIAGIWCYDPEIGLYHRTSPSVSPMTTITATSGNVNISTDIITTAGTLTTTGSPVKVLNKTSTIGGLTSGRVYYMIKLSATTFSLAETKELAIAGEKIDLTSTGSATNNFLLLEEYDFGQQLVDNIGGVALSGGRTDTYDKFIFGSEAPDIDSTTQYDHLCVTVPEFENRGYFVTPRILSSNIEDIVSTVYSGFKPLKANDKIIFKYKDLDLVGLPVSSANGRDSTPNDCTWIAQDSFTTTSDMADVLTAFDDGHELECEVIAGAGAGVMAKITSVTLTDTTYAFVLDEDVIGAKVGRMCDVKIDNWKLLEVVTSTSNGKNFKQVSGGGTSNWFKLKVELRGSDVAIYDQKLINKKHQTPA